MRKSIFLFIYIVSIHFSFGQTAPPEYDTLVKKAYSLYKAKDYNASANAYSAAFKTFGWMGYVDDRYNAACSWALTGIPDSAFFNLNRIVSKGYYKDYDHIISDPDLISLHEDKRWKPLLEAVKQNKDKEEANLNKPLLHLLDSLEKEDQRWRNYWIKYENKKLENDTISLQTIVCNWNLTDSLNYILADSIFKQYGFLNYDLVGKNGSHYFWLLVQHQDRHLSFQDSVLKAMKIAVDSGKAYGSDYAYLIDRVKVNSHEPQVYGTQMKLNKDSTSYEPIPVIEPEKLNERRKSVGLSTIEEYIEVMNEHNFGTLKRE